MHFLLPFLIAIILSLPNSACSDTIAFKSMDLSTTLRGILSFPDGPGPFPMVILLHPCGGLEPFAVATLQAHANTLHAAGFGTLIPDSYGPRNLDVGKACSIGTTASFRRGDAFAAMIALQVRLKVSKDNIFVLGLSDGGAAALLAAKGNSDECF